MRRQTILVLVIIILIAVAVGVWLRYGGADDPQPVVEAPEAPAAAAPERPVEPVIPVPALADSDGFVAGLAADLGVGALLEGGPGEWIRNFVRAIDTIASGESPKKTLAFLGPRGDYLVIERNGRFYPDPGSYRRYDAVSQAVGGLDARASVRGLDQLEPLMDEAFVDLGGPPQGFRARLVEALDVLLASPVPEGPSELVDVAVDRFEYSDAALESLLPVQKQFLRLGPDNQRRVLQKLGELRDLLVAGAP